jgi:CHAT domain-containing protein
MMRTEDHIGLPDLELLTAGSGIFSGGQEDRVNEIRNHLNVCRECAELAEAHQTMAHAANGRPGNSSIDCPKSESWLELAAGLQSEAETKALLTHAASCDACAAELRIAMQDVGGTEVEDEVRQLDSSSREWQARLAHRLATESGSKSKTQPHKSGKLLAFPQRRVWIGVIAATLLVGVMLAGWRVYRGQTDDALLARAYDMQRRTELRLPGGAAVMLAPVDRGNSQRDIPAELLRLQARAQEHRDGEPNAAYWHALLGRIALVENNGKAARKELQTAQSLEPQLPGLKRDLAAANFEIGDASNDPTVRMSSFLLAANLYMQVIDDLKDTRDQEERALAYFNLGLCWERQSINSEAVKNYTQALALEENSGWRDEIQRRLNLVQGIKSRSELNRRNLDLSPHTLLAAKQKDQQTAEQDYELYLDEATREWLAVRGSSPQTKAALEELAVAGTVHKDAWLRDMLAAPTGDAANEAVRHLAAAVQNSNLGDSDNTLTEAAAASRLFRQAGNIAGGMRSDAEMAYALQRLGKAGQCLDVAKPLLTRPVVDRYSWLHVYLLLEVASCSFDHGDIDEVTRDLEQALNISRSAELALQRLRAEGFLVSMYDALGQTRAVWTLSQEGLQSCIGRRGARMATYQFLHSIYLASETQGLRWAAAGVADAASQASLFVSNVPIQAYSHEIAGSAATAIGHYGDADAAFAEASELLGTMHSGAAANLYTADWEADRATLLAHRGQLQPALAQLRKASAAVESTDNFAVRQQNYTELASLLLRAGDTKQALHFAMLATEDAEHALGSTTGEVQRLAWERTNSRGYRLLVQCLVTMGRKEDALRAWEWYRSAPFRTTKSLRVENQAASDLPALPVLASERRRGLTLVVARLEDGYVVWSVPDQANGEVDMATVAEAPEQIELMANTLQELCSNRDSSESAIRLVGAKLYRSLFAPFRDRVEKADLLQFDLDAALRHMPIAALTQPSQRYVGIEHSLVVLPAWWSVRSAPEETISANPQTLLLEGETSIASSDDGSTSTLPEESLETRDLVKLYPRARLVRGQEVSIDALQKLLASAELFHFTGHTVQRNYDTGLLLSGPDGVFSAGSLKGVSMKACRLAVLATCSSTGESVHDLEDTGSLTHALLLAGAGNVVGTLWDVDSQSSRDLTLAFHASLRSALAPAQALRDAQRKLYGAPKTSHPFFWAAMEVFAG